MFVEGLGVLQISKQLQSDCGDSHPCSVQHPALTKSPDSCDTTLIWPVQPCCACTKRLLV